MRVALDEQVVLEGGRLGLVAVDDEVGDAGPCAASTTCARPGSRRRRGRAGSPSSTSAATASGVIVSALRSPS